ncbi:MAG: DUF5711 family protein [Chloroflexota bacterium]
MPDNMHLDYEFKPKRKGRPVRTYLLLGTGIILGILVTAVIGASALLFVGNSETVAVPQIDPTQSWSTAMTAPPSDAQAQSVDIQPTVISERIEAAEISPDNTHLAIASGDYISGLRLVELHAERSLIGEQYALSDENFDFLTFSQDSKWLLAINSSSGIAHLYSVEQRTLVDQYADVVGGGFTGEGDMLALVERNDIIRVLDTSGETPEFDSLIQTLSSTGNVSAVAVSNGERVALAYTNDNQVRVIDLTQNDAHLLVPTTEGYLHDITFTSDGTHLAMTYVNAGAQSSQIIIYNFAERSRQIFDYEVPIYSLAFSRYGEWLVVGGGQSGTGDAYLSAFRWDMNNPPIRPDAAYYQPLTLEGHSHTIYDVAFTPENYVLSASWDGSVRLWDKDEPNAAISVLLP